MEQTHHVWFPWSHHASRHGIIMDISLLHLSFIIFMHCICISHCIVIHIHLACFCSANCIHYVIIVRMLCIILPYSCSCLAFPSSSPKSHNEVWKFTPCFLVSCVGYHGNSYKQTMLGLYNPFSWKWLKSHEHGTQCIVNKKGWSFRHLVSVW